MNYRHGYHAGNVCDVVKHTLLVRMLGYLKDKNKPFSVLDTHSGKGLYALQSPESEKTFEYEQGILQIWNATPVPDSLNTYLQIIHKSNLHGDLKYYPGSPLIISSFLQASDHLICTELHPEEGLALKKMFHHQKQISVHIQNGYLALNAFLPFSQKRGLIFIDPPFEFKDEFDQLILAIGQGIRKFPNGIFMIWYPLKHKDHIHQFYQNLSMLNLPTTLKTEFYFYKAFKNDRLNGSGMLIINLPWNMEKDIEILFADLTKILAFEPGSSWTIGAMNHQRSNLN